MLRQPENLSLPGAIQPIDESWVAMEDLAEIASIGLRAAQGAALGCYNGGTWRGVRLKVRYVGKALQVYAPSLPADLRDIWHKRYKAGTAVKFPAPLDLPGADKYTARVAEDYALQCWKLDLIAPALQFPEGSRQRGAALRDIAGQEVTKPNDGGFCGFSRKSTTRLSSSTPMTPNSRASPIGTSMQATVMSAWCLAWKASMRP